MKYSAYCGVATVAVFFIMVISDSVAVMLIKKNRKKLLNAIEEKDLFIHRVNGLVNDFDTYQRLISSLNMDGSHQC